MPGGNCCRIKRVGGQGHRQEEALIIDDGVVIALVMDYQDLEPGGNSCSVGIFIQPKTRCKDMLTKFDMESVRTATTPYEAAKTKLKDDTDPPVNVHLYRSMIGSLMYLTASRPDIMFAVSACSRHQVTPLTSHLNAVKKIFKYLKGQPKLGLWYPKDSPFQLEAYSDSDYAGSHGDRKSTTGGCQFLGRRLISWQCKKQTIVATSSTEAEYVAAASCCAQVLWIQNQLLDYGFNFMNTKIFIDNQSTICIVKNPVFHQRTKHIEIRHHFIRDANEKNLIQVLKIHTDENVADLLTKAFDGPRFEYLVVHIGMVDMLFCGILFSCDCRSSMLLLVVILSAGRLVSAGCTMFLLVVILSAGRLVFCGRTNGLLFLMVSSLSVDDLVSVVALGSDVVILLLVALFLLVDSFMLTGFVYAANTSIHAAGLVCAGGIMFSVVRPNAAGSHDLVATIDGREVVVTESLIRTQLHFEDANGIVAMPNSDILEGMRVIGYPTDRALTFLKHHLSPQWRFLVHTLLHCLSPKSGSWNQFPSSIATALICLSTGREYNFSRFILEADRTPRPTFGFTRKLFSNMKFKWEGEGEEIPLTPPMLAIAAAGDAADEDNAAAHEAAGSSAEAHPGPHSPPVSPVRELTPERQPETEWVVPNPVSPIADWRPWPSVPPHSPFGISPMSLPQTLDFVDPTFVDQHLWSSSRPGTTIVFGAYRHWKQSMGNLNENSWGEAILDTCSRVNEVGTNGLTIIRMASEALGNDQPAVSSEDIEFRLFSTDVLPQADISESAGRCWARQRLEEEQASERLVQQLQTEALVQADLPLYHEERAKELDELMMRMTETDWLNLMMQVGSNPALARELLGADVTEDNFIERMTAIKERKKRALADLRYRALKGKPLKQSEVKQMMRNLVKNQWCAAHNGTITMTAVKAMTNQQLIDEYEYICRRLEKDRLLSAQYNLFRPKPVITEPPSKRQRVERAYSQPSHVPAATTKPADDHDSVGGSSFHPELQQWILLVNREREFTICGFFDALPINVSTDHVPLDVLFESTSGGINDFFLPSNADAQIGLSRVAVDPDSDDEVLAEILFRGKYILVLSVVVWTRFLLMRLLDQDKPVEDSSVLRVEARKGMHTSVDKNDSEDSDKVGEQEETVTGTETPINPVPVAMKTPSVATYKIIKQGEKGVYQIVREDGTDIVYINFGAMMKSISRDDLTELYRIVMNRYGMDGPEDKLEKGFWKCLRIMFEEPLSTDSIWSEIGQQKIISWRYYDTCRVHCLNLESMDVYMLSDRKYPLSAEGKLIRKRCNGFLGDLDRRRSLTGYVFTLDRCAISWKATIQSMVALSTTKAEYMAMAEGIKEAIWLKGLVGDLGMQQD
ncbi:hypothetical protein Tco_0894435 [Tanacetum coccineum]|uniref:Uncharacterized protein n=1 Tax=Tanacetum coccineum TaxID=301880 RepID=A0ABQ5CEE2_9ASTR